MEYLKKRVEYLFSFSLIFLPLATLIILIYRYGYRFPYWDEILYVPLYSKLLNGSLNLSDLLFFQNDHRPVFPRIWTLFTAWISNWNELLILYSSVFMSVIVFTILVSQVKNSNNTVECGKGLSTIDFITFSLLSLLIFSWNQMENWVWGLQMMVYMSNASAVGCFYLLSKNGFNRISYYLAVILAFISTFSYAGGLLAWFSALPIIFSKIFLKKRQNFLPVLIWVFLGIVVVFTYFSGYSKPGISTLGSKASIGNYILYFLLFIGGTLNAFFTAPPWHGPEVVTPKWYAYLFGIIGLVGLAVLAFLSYKCAVKRDENNNIGISKGREKFFFWISLILFSTLSGLVITYGRAGLGVGQALSSRYITTSMLFWCGLIGLANFYIKEKEVRLPVINSIAGKIFILRIIGTVGFIFIYLLMIFAPIYQNGKWHKIALWKNLGWYALCAGYDGRLYWTDLWGTRSDFIEPKIVKEKIFPIFKNYNLCGYNYFNYESVKKGLSRIYIEEAKQFISQKLWKPAVCYLDTAVFLNPELKLEIDNYKRQIPKDVFRLYEEYQKGTQ
ncbi:MAG: hypothetical protein N3G21_06515 [Candidatus Hydrogenedentes bacterium]|nr:hypothetical protein [Candidatus Hydrogenedentota bacterium]